MTDIRDQKFGIEIETVGISRQKVAEAIQSVVGGRVENAGGAYDAITVVTDDGRIWKAVRDGSIRSDNGFSAEIVSPVLTYGDLEALQNVVRVVKAAGAKVNSTCGVHIHVDAQPHTAKSLQNLLKIVWQQEDYIYPALQVRQGATVHFAKRTDEDVLRRVRTEKANTLTQMGRVWYGTRSIPYGQHYHSSRYHGLNLHSVWYRGTVEFRWFNSTLHAGRIKAYVQFCLALSAKALNSKAAVLRQRVYKADSAKYDFRCFLLGLGLIGDEFDTCRHHMLANLPGSSAYKSGSTEYREVA